MAKINQQNVRNRKIVAMLITSGILFALVGILVLVEWICTNNIPTSLYDDLKKILPLTIVPIFLCLIGALIVRGTDVKYDNPLAAIIAYSIFSAIGAVFSGMFISWVLYKTNTTTGEQHEVLMAFFARDRYFLYYLIAPVVCLLAAGYYALLTIKGTHYDSITTSYAFSALTITVIVVFLMLFNGISKSWASTDVWVPFILLIIAWCSMGVLSMQSHDNADALQLMHTFVVAIETVALVCSVIAIIIILICLAIIVAVGSGSTHHVKAGDTVVIH